jgi:Skp family chaperone for outer membrane proteins
LKQKRFVLSEDVLYQKQLDMAQMRNQIETRMKELEGRLQLDSKRLEGPLNKKLSEVIEAAGKEAGFTLILQRGSPGLLYTREALDITDLIIEKYNQKKS